jgi:hypothetical protein
MAAAASSPQAPLPQVPPPRRLTFTPGPRRAPLASAMRLPKGQPRWSAASAARIAKIKEMAR